MLSSSPDGPLRDLPAPAPLRTHENSLLTDTRTDREWIYFVQGGHSSGPIKIGRAADPVTRLYSLRTSAPFPLTLLLAYPGAERDERSLHLQFAQARLHGEWFRPAPELLAFIAEQAMRPGARKRKLPNVLSRDEAKKLLAAPNTNCPTGLRNRCMLELMYRAGLRVGEVCALKPRDVDLAGGLVRVWDGKGGDGTAYFDSESLKSLLEQWKAVRRALPRGEHLFCTLKGGPVSVRYMEAMFQRMRRRAKIETAATPHTLRHTFATELLDEGFNLREVQEAVRHADVSTTQIYTHVLDVNLREKIQRRSR